MVLDALHAPFAWDDGGWSGSNGQMTNSFPGDMCNRLSLEDVGETGAVSLSVTRQQIKELPGEDLADAIQTLSGQVQHAVFSALDSEKAAEVLTSARSDDPDDGSSPEGSD